jgi:hypothetical protein
MEPVWSPAVASGGNRSQIGDAHNREGTPNPLPWVHLLLGIGLVVTGYFLFVRRPWAGVVTLMLAALSAASNFFFIPYYPFWSILNIALAI